MSILDDMAKYRSEGMLRACKFCEAMKVNRQIEEVSRSWTTDDESKHYGKYMVEYTVAIVKRSWYQKIGKRRSERSVEFRYRGSGFELNFCPECGADMKGGETT